MSIYSKLSNMSKQWGYYRLIYRSINKAQRINAKVWQTIIGVGNIAICPLNALK